MFVTTAILAVLVPSAEGGLPQEAPAPQVTIMSPVDAAIVTASPQQSEPHHTFGGDWSADISGPGATYARFANASGPLVLTMEHQYDPCGVPSSGGLGVVVGVSVAGKRIGTVTYLHLETVEVQPGVIANGARLGPMVTNPPVRSRCWGNVHTHVEPANDPSIGSRSCWVRRSNHTWVDYGTPVGVLGGNFARSMNEICPPGAEDGRDPSGPASYDPVGRLDAAMRVDAGIRLAGWARDEDAPGRPIAVQGLVDGRPAGQGSAADSAGGLAAPAFAFVVPADGGPHEVCARASNVGGGHDVTLAECVRVGGNADSVPLSATT